MRMMEQGEAPSASNNNNNNGKHAQNASNKIQLVVQKVLLPLLYTPLPSAVSFKKVQSCIF